ncbi:MAG: hypothetical protein AB4038_19570 [Prochloraceae cyanobacterium]
MNWSEAEKKAAQVALQRAKEGWLHLDELEGFDKDKLAKVTALART